MRAPLAARNRLRPRSSEYESRSGIDSSRQTSGSLDDRSPIQNKYSRALVQPQELLAKLEADYWDVTICSSASSSRSISSPVL